MTDPADLPPVAVHSVGEVLAIAHAMEREAVARYAKHTAIGQVTCHRCLIRHDA